MPNLEQAILEKQQVEESAAQQEAAQQAGESRRKVAEQLGHYEALMGSEEWEWFLRGIAGEAARREHDAALDVEKTPEQRNNHAHRHDAISKLFTGMDSTRARLRNELSKLNNP